MAGDDDAVSTQLAAILVQMKKLDTIEDKLQNLEMAQHSQQQAITRLESSQTVATVPDGHLRVTREPPSAALAKRAPPRYYKLDFPTFDGKSDTLPWVNWCEHFFHRQRTLEEEKVWLAAYHLIDGA